MSEKAVSEAVREARRKLEGLFAGSGDENPAGLRREMNRIMDARVAIFRTSEGLAEAVEGLGELKQRYRRLRPIYDGKRFNYDLIWAFELEGTLCLAELVAAGALAREESRGSHCRKDHPGRDDASWLKHTIAHVTEDRPKLGFRPVTVTRWQPEERTY